MGRGKTGGADRRRSASGGVSAEVATQRAEEAPAAAPRIEPAIWKEPVRGSYPNPRIFGLPGIEQLRTFFRGQAPPPPLHHLTGVRPTHVAPGAATFVMPATPWLLTPVGYISLGALALLADGSLGCAVQSVLPPATPYTTSDLSMSFLRPLEADGATVTARGKLIHAGRSLGVSDVLIEDGEGRPIAHGTTRCFVLPPIDPPPAAPKNLAEIEPRDYDTPDPFQRPVIGHPLGQEAWDRMSGLEIMRAHAAGELPPPPISHLTGLRPVEVRQGVCSFVLPATPWLTSPAGTVQGGALALLADTAAAGAVQTTIPRRTAYAPLDLKVNYLRPVFADGRDLLGRATIIHRGRTMAVARVELSNAEGKTVAVATGTALIREGMPWRPTKS